MREAYITSNGGDFIKNPVNLRAGEFISKINLSAQKILGIKKVKKGMTALKMIEFTLNNKIDQK